VNQGIMPSWSAGGGQEMSRPSSQSKVVQVQAQVDAVKGVMQENVEVMLANIDKTEVLENKSAELANQAKTFHKTARATKRHMCRQNAKMNVIICCIIVAIVLALTMSFIPWGSFGGDGGGGGGGGGRGSVSPSSNPLPSPSLPPGE